MAKKTALPYAKIGGVLLIGVGALDLSFGSTNTPLLPGPLANVLTQQIDVVLIGAGLILFFVNF